MPENSNPLEESRVVDSEAPERPPLSQVVSHTGRELTPQVISIMTTEHYNLQSGRAMTISDSNGRASLFLGTVSTSLVALAFVGQISRTGVGLGQAFYIFALVLFPTLVFLGLVTFERVLQSGVEDIIYAHGINRIRHLYQEHAPEMTPYFILSSSDDEASIKGNLAMHASWLQTFLSTAGMIAVITSVLIGSFGGILVAELFGAPLVISACVGAIVFLTGVVGLQRYQWAVWGRSQVLMPSLFPSRPTSPTAAPRK